MRRMRSNFFLPGVPDPKVQTTAVGIAATSILSVLYDRELQSAATHSF